MDGKETTDIRYLHAVAVCCKKLENVQPEVVTMAAELARHNEEWLENRNRPRVTCSDTTAREVAALSTRLEEETGEAVYACAGTLMRDLCGDTNSQRIKHEVAALGQIHHSTPSDASAIARELLRRAARRVAWAENGRDRNRPLLKSEGVRKKYIRDHVAAVLYEADRPLTRHEIELRLQATPGLLSGAMRDHRLKRVAKGRWALRAWDEREYLTAVNGLRDEIERAGGRARLPEVANRIAREHGLAAYAVEATAKAASSGFTVDADGWIYAKGRETEAR